MQQHIRYIVLLRNLIRSRYHAVSSRTRLVTGDVLVSWQSHDFWGFHNDHSQTLDDIPAPQILFRVSPSRNNIDIRRLQLRSHSVPHLHLAPVQLIFQ
jgi:hypothetical protein